VDATVGDERDRLISASARNQADWHDASLRALGVRTSRTGGLWSREPTAPSIYLRAMTLCPVREAPQIAAEIGRLVESDPGAPIVMWDSFGELDLAPLGLSRAPWTGQWWAKAATTRTDEPRVEGLEIERVTDRAGLEAFGVATADGFESDAALRAGGALAWHDPETLADPRMRYFVGRLDGRVVTSSIAYVGRDVVGIYGVSTLPEFRRRGFGKAITWAAATVAPKLDVILAPDEMARGIDAELGFSKLAEFAPWTRQPS